jgi:16S rRNA (adenine1518-N6/adenine1519-N6)-dimethyltransferase
MARHRPKKSLGQHFLADRHYRSRIAELLGLDGTQRVIEIGPGRGEMSALIAPRAARLACIELDRDVLPALEAALAPYPHTKIFCADVRKADMDAIAQWVLEGAPRAGILAFGNIPYYITTPILEKLIPQRHRIRRIVLTVQKEFAHRMASAPGSKEFGALSCFAQYHAHCRVLLEIPRGAFWPVPKVDSSVVELRLKETLPCTPDEEKRLFFLIRAAFTQRRKMLRSALKGFAPAAALEQSCAACAVDSRQRPETLSLEQFICLSSRIFRK